MATYKVTGMSGNRWNLKYDKDKHPDELIKTFTDGDYYAQFCADHDIGERTFFEWLDKHKEFADAYEVAKMKGRAWWERRGKTGLSQENFSATAWSMTMRNRFGYTEHRRVGVKGLDKAKDALAKMLLLEGEVSKGNLTGAELSHLSGLIESGVRVSQNTKMEEDIALIKTTLGIKE